MSRKAIAAALALFLAGGAAAQVRITGVVTESGGSSAPTPVPEAYVQAKTGSPERVIAEAATDSRGRYALSGLPVGRIALSVQARGYYTVRAGDLDSESLIRSCPGEGDCGETSFEVARAAVVEGWLTDIYGEPRQDAEIQLTPEAAPEPTDPSGRRGRVAGHAISDDRGYFRMWGLRPGRYELVARQRTFNAGGPQMTEQKQNIEIAPGETAVQARVVIAPTENVPTYSISGAIAGVAEEDLRRTGVAVQPAGDDAQRYGWTSFSSLSGRTFSMTGLRAGRYVLRLTDLSGGERNWRYLATLSVDRDLTDLELTPQPPAGIRGRLEFVDSPAAPQFLSAGPPGATGYGMQTIQARPPGYAFENIGMPPGDYELTVRSPDYYLVDPTLFRVAPGQVQDLVLKVSNQRAIVRGKVRLASGEERAVGANFVVAVRGERGRRQDRADDSGGFVLEKLIPGEYEIAAWEGPEVDTQDDEAWRRAAKNVRRIVLEAGFETEVDLTVTP